MNLLITQTIHILCYSPISFITYLILGRMLKIRRHVLFAFVLTALHVFFHILYTIAVYYQVPWADPVRTVVQIALDLIVPVIASDRKPWIAVLGGSLTLLAGVVGEMVSLFTFASLNGTFDIHGMTDPFANPTAYIAMYAINLTATLVFLAIVWFLWIRIVEKSRPEIVWYYLLFPTSQVVLLAVAGIYCTTYNMPLNRYLYLLIAAIFCFAADWILFRSMRELSEKTIADERALWYEQLLDQQQSYYSYILADQEEASHIRHDMRNQIQTVYALMQSGDSDTAQAQLGELTRMTEQHQSFCRNRIVDAILHVKELQYRDRGIKLQCQCSVPDDLAVAGTDLCSLFSNLLDNAANAVEPLEPQQKIVSLSSVFDNNVFTVRCENPYPGEESLLPSHRPDGHGLGLSILEDLAKRYQGEMNTETDNEIFKVALWLLPSDN